MNFIKQPGIQIFSVLICWMLFNVVSIKMEFGDLLTFSVSCIVVVGPLLYIADRLLKMK